MKLTHLLPLAAVTSAFVLPSAETFREVETCHDETTPWYKTLFGDSERRLDDTKDALRRLVSQATEVSSDAWERVEETSEDAWEQVADSSRNAFDFALENAYEFAEDVEDEFVQTRDDVESWMEAQADGLQDAMDYAVLEAEDFMLETDEFMMDVDEEDHHGPPPPHHGPPPPHHGPPPPPHGDNGHHGDHGHHGGHGRHGHHGHHGDHDHDKHPKANETVLNLIKSSKYTTILAKVLDDHPKIAKLLNTTDFNGTVFAPTDKAFERIPKKFFEGLSKSQHEDLLKYHIVPGFYPAKRVLFTHTAPTLLESKQLSSKHPQRLRIGKSFKGLTVNFLSRIIAADIHATNGVIHGIDNLLFPPISAIHEIDLFPGEFSTLNLGLHKTGIWDKLNDTSHRGGGTFFAPNNWAFQKLGPRVNAFLFSSHGEKYLKALLKYHLVSKNTLYSDAFYPEKDSKDKEDAAGGRNIHVDLPTALKDRSLSIDITNWGPVVWMKVNGFTSVSVTDVVAADGVIQIMSSVLIPPKHAAMEEVEEIEEGEMTVEELIERLEPHVEEEEWKLDL